MNKLEKLITAGILSLYSISGCYRYESDFFRARNINETYTRNLVDSDKDGSIDIISYNYKHSRAPPINNVIWVKQGYEKVRFGQVEKIYMTEEMIELASNISQLQNELDAMIDQSYKSFKNENKVHREIINFSDFGF